MSEFVELIISSIGLTRQQLQFLTRAAWVVFVTFHISWVCGWLTFLGLATPFATAAEEAKQDVTIQELEQKILEGQLHKLDYDIFQLRVQQCHAPPGAKDQYAARLQELVNEYAKLTKQYPRVPPCDEV